MPQTQKQTLSELLVVAGIAAYAYYRYSKMTTIEKQNVHEEIKEIGEKVVKGLIPPQFKPFLPQYLK